MLLFQISITQMGVEKLIWCRKQKLSRIQFYIFIGPPNIFQGSNIFYFENLKSLQVVVNAFLFNFSNKL